MNMELARRNAGPGARTIKRMVTLAATAICAGCAGAAASGNEPAIAASGANACAKAKISPSHAVMQLPFDLVHGRIYVDARVNGGGPYRFAIDTGASGMGRADASLTAHLGLPVIGQSETSDGVTTASVDVVKLESLRLGGLERRELEVITRDYSSGAPPGAEISGIVGRDFFSDGLLVIDYPSTTISFSRRIGLTDEDAGALAYERPFRVPVRIGELETIGHLDTGANVKFVLPRTLYDAVSAEPLDPAGRGRLTNTDLAIDRGVVRGPIRVGEAEASNVEVRVSDRFPELLVGGEFLRDTTIMIDQRSRLVAVCAAPGSFDQMAED